MVEKGVERPIFRILENPREYVRELRSEVRDELLGREGLPIVVPEERFWKDYEAEVNALVFGKYALEILKLLYGDTFLTVFGTPDVFLYEVKTEPRCIQTTIRDIRSNPEAYAGKVVCFEASAIGFNISTKKSIEAAAAALGQPIEVPADVLLGGVVLVPSPAPTIDEIRGRTGYIAGIYAYGDAQKVLAEPVNELMVVNRYVARIVSAGEVSERLSDRVVAIIFEKERVRDKSFEEVTTEAKARLQELARSVRESIESGETVSGEVEFKKIAEIARPEEPLRFSIGKEVKDIVLKVKNPVRDVGVVVERLEGLPPQVQPPSGKLYISLRISVNIYSEDLEEAKINVTVSKEWVVENNVDPETIKVMKYVDRWIELPTRLVAEDESYFYFEATTTGFSYFVVVGEEKGGTTATPMYTQTPAQTSTWTHSSEMTTTLTPETVQTQQTASIQPAPEKKVPGFEVVLAVVGFTLAQMLRRMRS